MTAENIVKAVVTTTATIYMGRAYLGVSMVTKETCVKHVGISTIENTFLPQ